MASITGSVAPVDGRMITAKAMLMDNVAPLRMILYSNNYTPVAGSVLASFTRASFSGYATQFMAINANQPSLPYPFNTVTFSYAAVPPATPIINQIYGWVIYDPTKSNVTIMCDKFSAPVTMQAGAGPIRVNADLQATTY